MSLAVCVHFAPATVATEQLLRSVGIIKDQVLFAPAAPMPVLQGPAANAYNSYSTTPGASGSLAVVTRPAPPPVVMAPVGDIEHKVRGANAVATMSAGILGLLLGSLAFAKCQPQSVAS
jgi:hypothetical protein